jgi:C4-dicarboxylate transporter
VDRLLKHAKVTFDVGTILLLLPCLFMMALITFQQPCGQDNTMAELTSFFMGMGGILLLTVSSFYFTGVFP